jgi:hypothetical protein
MNFSQAQFDEFKLRMMYNLDRNVRVPIFNGMKFKRNKIKAFRIAVESLYEYGVDIRRILRLKKRIKWQLFLKFGWR